MSVRCFIAVNKKMLAYIGMKTFWKIHLPCTTLSLCFFLRKTRTAQQVKGTLLHLQSSTITQFLFSDETWPDRTTKREWSSRGGERGTRSKKRKRPTAWNLKNTFKTQAQSILNGTLLLTSKFSFTVHFLVWPRMLQPRADRRYRTSRNFLATNEQPQRWLSQGTVPFITFSPALRL